MMYRSNRLILFGLLAAWPAIAEENMDIDLIPRAIQDQMAPVVDRAPASGPRQRIYFENANTLASLRAGLLVPFPSQRPPTWQEEFFIDARKEWSLLKNFNFAYSGRMNLRVEENLPIPRTENVRHDFREGYLSWEALDRTYLDLGRINLKSGVALGYNPTDFFKSRSVVEALSSDLTVLREDRLGTLMGRAQHVWAGGALSAVFAPRLFNPRSIYTNLGLPSFNPMFDRTNAHGRVLVKGNANIAGGVSTEFLIYHEGNRFQLGANVTEELSHNIVGYAEWAGGRRASLIDDALRYGKQTGSIPVRTPSALPEDGHKSFQSDLSVGASYSTETRITFNLEYHFHQAGFSQRDWNNWFNSGSGLPAYLSRVPAQLWYIRSYALDQQEPISTHTAFLRADWVDAFFPKLELTAFINIDLFDGSAFVQVTADYYLSNAWTVGGLVTRNFGKYRSDHGSLPQSSALLFKVARYL